MKARQRRDSLYWMAVLLGLVPLLTGIAVYVAWTQTRNPELVGAGLATIYGGLLLLGIGLLCVLLHLRRHSGEGVSIRSLGRHAALPICVLLLNFPVGLYISSLALTDLVTYRITVQNESEALITRFTITAPGVEEEWAPIHPGESRSARFGFTPDGLLIIVASVEGGEEHVMELSYVTGGLGGVARITLRPDLRFNVEQQL